VGQSTEAELLRVFVGQLDKHGHRPLYEVIVEMARKRGLAGASVLRGLMGFGGSGGLHAANVLRLPEDVPVVIEIIDTPDKISAFLPGLERLVGKGAITRQQVSAIFYRKKPLAAQAGE